MARRSRSLLLAATLALSALAVPASAPAGASLPQAMPVSGALGEFHPLSPDRIFDSRRGIGTTAAPRIITATGSSAVPFDVQLLGVAGVPANPSHVYAVMANITVISPSAEGYLVAYPKGEARPLASTVNFKPGQVVPNMTVLRPGADGQARMALEGRTAGQAHVIVDVFGWVSTSQYPTRGARLRGVQASRLYDSRQTDQGAFGAGESRSVMFRGASASGVVIPNSTNIVGAVLNVTGINNRPNSQGTYISVLPTAPSSPPSTSNLNLARGVTKANLVIVPLGPDGRFHLYNAQGQTNIAVDVVGYLITNTGWDRLGRIIPLRSPFRALDTRTGPGGPQRLGPGQAEPWDFYCAIRATTVGGQQIGLVDSVIGNLTGTSFQQQYWNSPLNTYLTMYPFNRPVASTLNFSSGETVANMAVSRLFNGVPQGTTQYQSRLFVYNAEGFVHYLFDVSAMVLGDGTLPSRPC